MAVNIVAPLVRFSYATGAPNFGSNDLRWTHNASDGMFFRLSGTDASIPDGALKMDIVCGTETLAAIDLAWYLNESARVRVEGRLPLIHASHKENILQVVRDISNNQKQRIQVRFARYEQYMEIVDILQARGLQMREARQNGAGRRPNTAMSGHRPDTAISSHRPDTAITDHRPNTAQHSIQSSPQRPAQSGTIRVPDLEIGSLSQQPGFTRGPSRITSTEQPASRIFEYEFPPMIVRNHPVAEPRVAPSDPTSTALLRNPTMPIQQAGSKSGDYTNVGPHQVRPSSTNHTDTWKAIQQAAAEDTRMDVDVEMRPPSSAFGPRPLTSTATSTQSPLPPVTARPGTTGGSRPGSRALTMEPLPKPKMTPDVPYRPSHQMPSSDSRPSSAVRPLSAISPTRMQALYTSVPHATSSSPAGGGHFASDASISGRADALLQNFEDSVDQSANALSWDERLARQSANASKISLSRMGSLADAPHEIESPPRRYYPTGKQQSGTQPRRDGYAEHDYVSVTQSMHFPDDSVLERFDAQNPEERMAIMNQFILDNLHDPAFVTLCEMAERDWKLGVDI